jgi:VCBS repeat-containing protein
MAVKSLSSTGKKSQSNPSGSLSIADYLEQQGFDISQLLGPEGEPIGEDGVELELADGSIVVLMPDGSLVFEGDSKTSQTSELGLLVKTDDGQFVKIAVKVTQTEGQKPSVLPFASGSKDKNDPAPNPTVKSKDSGSEFEDLEDFETASTDPVLSERGPEARSGPSASGSNEEGGREPSDGEGDRPDPLSRPSGSDITGGIRQPLLQNNLGDLLEDGPDLSAAVVSGSANSPTTSDVSVLSTTEGGVSPSLISTPTLPSGPLFSFARDDAAAFEEDQEGNDIPRFNVLGNDYAHNDAELRVVTPGPGVVDQGVVLSEAGNKLRYLMTELGDVTLLPGGEFNSLATGEVDTVRIPYQMIDSNGTRSTAEVVVTVTGRNDAPIARDDVLGAQMTEEVRIDEWETGTKTNVKSVQLTDGAIAYVWQSFDDVRLGDGDEQVINLHILNADGSVRVSEKFGNTYLGYIHEAPQLTAMGENVFLSWRRTSTDEIPEVGFHGMLFSGQTGQAISPNVNGVRFGETLPDVGLAHTHPAILDIEGEQSFWASWLEVTLVDGAAQPRLTLQKMSHSGLVQTTKRLDVNLDHAPSDFSATSFQPHMVQLDDGNFAVLWHTGQGDRANPSDNGNMVVQVFNEDGARISSTSESLSKPAEGSAISLAKLEDGGFVAVYAAEPASLSDGEAPSGAAVDADMIQLNFYSETATDQIIGMELLHQPGHNLRDPDVAMLANGNLVITWAESDGGGDDFDIKATILNPDGTEVIKPAFVVNSTRTGDQHRPDVIALEYGGFRIHWDSEDGTPGDGQDSVIMGKSFTADGYVVRQVVEGVAKYETTMFTPEDLLGNDSDVDGDSLAIDRFFNIDGVSYPGFGQSELGAFLSFDDLGNIHYNPVAVSAIRNLEIDETLTDSFEYFMSDGNGGFNAATATIIISGKDNPLGPQGSEAVDDNVSLPEDDALVDFNLLDNDYIHLGRDTRISEMNGVLLDVRPEIRFDLTTEGGRSVFLTGVQTGDVTIHNLFNNSLAEGETDTLAITYAIVDDKGFRSEAVFRLTFEGQNDGVVVGQPLINRIVNEGQAGEFDLAVGFRDIDDSDELTYSAKLADGSALPDWMMLDAATGMMTVNAPDAGADRDLSYSVTVTASDSHGESLSQTFDLAVGNVNEAPVANPDEIGTADVNDALPIAGPTILSISQLLGNDADGDGDMLSLHSVTPVSRHGATITLNNDGTFTYDPSGSAAIAAMGPGEVWEDTISYIVEDGYGGISTSYATIAIAHDVLQGNDITLSVSEDLGTPHVLFSAQTNNPGAEFSYSLVPGQAAQGVVTLNADSSFSYNTNGKFDHLRAGETTTEIIRYQVSDQYGRTDEANIIVTIEGRNDGPVALAGTNVLSANALASHFALNFLDLDNGDSHSFTVDSSGLQGELIHDGNGQVSYRPTSAFDSLAAGEIGYDSFSWTVTDASGASSTAQMTFQIVGINEAPVARAAHAEIDELGDAIVISVPFSDVDASDIHGFELDASKTQGLVINNGDGTFSYHTNDAFADLADGETAFDEFSYVVTDQHGASSQQTITIEVTGQSNELLAYAITGVASEHGSVDVMPVFEGIAARDHVTTVLDTSGLSGQASLNVDGSFHYEAGAAFDHLGANEHAVDTFSYTIVDSDGRQSTAVASIIVTGENDAPLVHAIRSNMSETASSIDIQTSFSDVDTNDTHSFSFDVAGTHGSVTHLGNGLFRYAPDPDLPDVPLGQSVSDSFSYTVTDAAGASSTETVTVQISGENDAPNVNDLAGTISESGNIDLQASFTDLDDKESHSFSVDTSGVRGLVQIDDQGLISYDTNGRFEHLGAGESATEQFIYSVSDQDGLTTSATVTLAVTGENDAPVARAISAQAMEEDNVIQISADFSDRDVSDSHSFEIDSSGTIGTVTNNGDGTFAYRPNGQFDVLDIGETTIDSFRYSVVDEQGARSTETVTITITGTNNPPRANDIAGSVTENGNTTLQADFTDADGDDSHVFDLDTTGLAGIASIDADGQISYDTNGQFESLKDGETATEQFSYTVTDRDGQQSTRQVSITVMGENDAPEAQAIRQVISENQGTFSIVPDFTDRDEGDRHTISVDTTGTLGTVTPHNPSDTAWFHGLIDYDPGQSYDALREGESITDRFSYTITDEAGESSTQVVEIVIEGRNDAPVAQALAESLTEDDGVTLQANFTDADDGDSHSFELDVTGLLGTASIDEHGQITYDTNGAFDHLHPGQIAVERFSYHVSDASGAQTSEEVVLTITGTNDVPVVRPVSVTTHEDRDELEILPDFTDADQEFGHSLLIDLSRTRGQAREENGVIIYSAAGAFDDLALGESATDVITYSVQDMNGDVSSNTISIVVEGRNDAPVAHRVSGEVGQDGTLTLQASFSDADQETGHGFAIEPLFSPAVVNFAAFAVSPEGSGRGTISIDANGQINYDTNGQFDHLQIGESEIDRFSYSVTDEHGAVSQGTIEIKVTGSNDAPVARAVSQSITEETRLVQIAPDFSDVDDSEGHRLELDDSSTIGAVSLIPIHSLEAGGIFSYDASGRFDHLNVGETATDSFTYRVIDAHGGQSSETVTITITGTNDGPVAERSVLEFDADDDVVSLAPVYRDIDDDIDSLAVDFLDGFGDHPLDLTPVQSPDDPNQWELRPGDHYASLGLGETAHGTLTFTVTDPHGATSIEAIDVTVHGKNDAPTAEGRIQRLEEGEGGADGVTFSLSYNDLDQNDVLEFSIDVPDDFKGRLINNNNGTVTYYQDDAFAHLEDGELGGQSFAYTVSDQHLASATSEVILEIEGKSTELPGSDAVSVGVTLAGESAQNLTYNMRSEVALKVSGGSYYARPHEISHFDMDDAGNVTAFVDQWGLAGVRGIIRVDVSGQEPVMSELTSELSFHNPLAGGPTSIWGIKGPISVSADGSQSVVLTSSDGLLQDATWDQLAHIDWESGEATQASSWSGGQLINTNGGWGGVWDAQISDDGSKVLFLSKGNVPGIPDGNGNGASLYMWDRDAADGSAEKLQIVSTGVTALGGCFSQITLSALLPIALMRSVAITNMPSSCPAHNAGTGTAGKLTMCWAVRSIARI